MKDFIIPFIVAAAAALEHDQYSGLHSGVTPQQNRDNVAASLETLLRPGQACEAYHAAMLVMRAARRGHRVPAWAALECIRLPRARQLGVVPTTAVMVAKRLP